MAKRRCRMSVVRAFKPVVQIDPDKHPELAAELASINDPRAHAERIRMLATMALKMRAMDWSSAEAVKPKEEPQKNIRTERRKSYLTGRIEDQCT